MASEGITHIPPFQDKEGVPAVEVTEAEAACSAPTSRNNSLTQASGVASGLQEGHQASGISSFKFLFFS